MARPNTIVLPISSDVDDPVMIEVPKAQNAIETSKALEAEYTKEIIKEKEEEEKAESVYESDADREPRWAHRERIIYNSRDYSPPPRPHGFASHVHQIPILVDTKSLNRFIKMNDVCADTANNQMVYIANHPFHAADLEQISWIFKMGVRDTWVKKPVPQKERERDNSEERGRGRYYEDRYDRPDMDGPGPFIRKTAIARLGNALRVFKSDEKKYGTEKVKFLIAVKERGNGGWMKLRIAHSRQAAMVDIFHEILNGYEILFVGAVLQDVIVPAEKKDKTVKFERVSSLKEAQKLEKGVIGVIC